LPVVGIFAYILFGEVNIGRRRVARLRKVLEEMPDFPARNDSWIVAAASRSYYAGLLAAGVKI
jgi:hypothetical protein